MTTTINDPEAPISLSVAPEAGGVWFEFLGIETTGGLLGRFRTWLSPEEATRLRLALGSYAAREQAREETGI